MNQEKIGKLIKEIRQKNNLTQKQFADKYGITYQAVSKWENGKNMPDVSLLKQISKDFKVNIEDLLEGNISFKKKKHTYKIGVLVVIFLILFLTILYILKNDTFEFKTLSSRCGEFNISGSIAYNDKKSSIYISNIDYCGEGDDNYYKDIECILYENNNKTDTKIDIYKKKSMNVVKIGDFLKNASFHIDNYDRTCKVYSKNSLYLQINATTDKNKHVSYKIPLSIDKDCKSNSTKS